MATILVTGCSSGIGLHAALELSKQGFNVIATIRDTNVPEELKDKLLIYATKKG